MVGRFRLRTRSILAMYFVVNVRIKLLGAFRADPMTEFSFGMVPDVLFDLIPIALIVSNFFAAGADGQKTA